MAKEKATPPAQAEGRKRLFGVYDDVKDLTSNDIGRFKLVDGNNRMRIITEPIPVPKHWDLPESADAKVVPCLRFFGDKLHEMGDAKRKKEIVDALPECPWCELEAEFGNKALGKDKGYYNKQFSHTMGVLSKEQSLVFEVSQKSVMEGLSRFEQDDQWAEDMPNGLQDMEIIIKRIAGKPTKYEVGAAPRTGPLSDEDLAAARSALPDLMALCRPPNPNTEEGELEIAALLRKNGAPVKGDSPKKSG